MLYENTLKYQVRAGEDLRDAKGLALYIGNDGKVYKTKSIKDNGVYTLSPNFFSYNDTTDKMVEVMLITRGMVSLQAEEILNTNAGSNIYTTENGKVIASNSLLDGNKIGVNSEVPIGGIIKVYTNRSYKLPPNAELAGEIQLEDGSILLLENDTILRLEA